MCQLNAEHFYANLDFIFHESSNPHKYEMSCSRLSATFHTAVPLPFSVLKYLSGLRCRQGRPFPCLNVKAAFLPQCHCNLCRVSCSSKTRMCSIIPPCAKQSHLSPAFQAAVSHVEGQQDKT